MHMTRCVQIVSLSHMLTYAPPIARITASNKVITFASCVLTLAFLIDWMFIMLLLGRQLLWMTLLVQIGLSRWYVSLEGVIACLLWSVAFTTWAAVRNGI